MRENLDYLAGRSSESSSNLQLTTASAGPLSLRHLIWLALQTAPWAPGVANFWWPDPAELNFASSLSLDSSSTDRSAILRQMRFPPRIAYDAVLSKAVLSQICDKNSIDHQGALSPERGEITDGIQVIQKRTSVAAASFFPRPRCAVMLNYYNPQFSESSSTLRMDQTPPRRLPSVPTPPSSSIESRRSSRPLPKIPRALTCKQCQAVITSNNVLFPTSKMPPNSRAFRGFAGKASLFTETYNVREAKPGIQLMATGAHTMSEVTCGSCNIYLGWKIVRAHEEQEKWKEGKFLLELEHLHAQPDHVAPLNLRTPNRSSSGSDSGSDY